MQKRAQPATPPTLDRAFEAVSEDLLEMFLKKHRDYGKGNILANGELGIAMRVAEKIERLKHLLLSQQTPANESIDETWTDIAVYAVIAKLYRSGQFQALDVDQKRMDHA
jgi:hypothetical protein